MRFYAPRDFCGTSPVHTYPQPCEFGATIAERSVGEITRQSLDALSISQLRCASFPWVLSSAGRASPLQGEGRRFETVSTHQIKSTACTLLGSAREAQDRQRGTSAGLGNAVGRRQEIPELRRAVVGRHAS